MNDNTFWILLAVTIAGSLGLMLGMILGDEVRRRKNAEATVKEFNQRLQKSCFVIAPEKQIMKIFHIVVDIHKQITAVSKGLQKPTK